MKTVPNNKSVTKYINSIDNESRRTDSFTLLELFQKITGDKPVLWGDSIIGFGSYHYRYASGREGDFFLTGFSPRKQHMVLYIMNGCKTYLKELETIGKHKTGSSCLYVNRLSGIDIKILQKIISDSVDQMRSKYK